jgi:hypothetical protein
MSREVLFTCSVCAFSAPSIHGRTLDDGASDEGSRVV